MAFIPIYILILVFTIVIDYIAGILIENAHEKKRKRFLLLSIIANVGVLVVFKYYNFFIDNTNDLLHSLHISHTDIPLLNIILPIGLSFHTFQAMSYTIEVYRGNQKAERHFGIYALYVMFYPQLLAGPIERPQNLIHQFKEEHPFNYGNATSGIRLMMWGIFKKVVIADRLALFVDPVFASPAHYPSLTLFIAAAFFTFELYCDFSGYSDIAIGAARVMGFTLMRNFNFPFIAQNISELWRRWHISLSSWINDYLFSPLSIAFRNLGKWGLLLSLNIAFLLAGLWHGANWTFVIFGILNGIALSYDALTKKFRKKIGARIPKHLYINISIILTFLYFTLSQVFFRSKNVHTAFYILHRFPGTIKEVAHSIYTRSINLGVSIPTSQITISFALLIFLLLAERILRKKEDFQSIFIKQPIYIRWAAYYSLIIAILLMGEFGSRNFIYFQF